MDRGGEQLRVDFNNSAVKLFFALFEKFQAAVSRIDRRVHEQKFQEVLNKFTFTLRNQLENIAKEIIEKNQPYLNTSFINKTLKDGVDRYVNEFLQKSQSL